MKKLAAIIAVALTCSPLARAADVAKPEKSEIPALIKQLGDDSPQARDEASQKLRQLGADALPSLAEAAKSDDPEVVSRAQVLTRQIDEDLHPKAAVPTAGGRTTLRLQRPAGVAIAPGVVHMRVNGSRSVSVVRGADGKTLRETSVTEGGQTITVRESPAEISVTTTEQADGKEVTATFKAKDRDALKKENPKAYELYEKAVKPGPGGVMRVQGGIGGIGADGGIDPQLDAELQKALRDARAVHEQQMKLAQEQLREARQLLEQQKLEIQQLQQQQREELKQQQQQQQQQQKQ